MSMKETKRNLMIMKLIKIVKKMTYIGHEFHMLVISLQSADLE